MLEVETPTEPTATAGDSGRMSNGDDDIEAELPSEPVRSEHGQWIFEQRPSAL
jgi:hypothetical protein